MPWHAVMLALTCQREPAKGRALPLANTMTVPATPCAPDILGCTCMGRGSLSGCACAVQEQFQVRFWKLRQAEYSPYTLQCSPLRVSRSGFPTQRATSYAPPLCIPAQGSMLLHRVGPTSSRRSGAGAAYISTASR